MSNEISTGEPCGVVRLRLTIAYDGTLFAGSQRQARGRTVQAELERAASELHGRPVDVKLAGRTDSGVHALGMVAAYDAETRLGPEVIGRALNAKLPEDLRVVGCELADTRFHPRHDAVRKLYRYRLWVAEQRHPLVRLTTWHQRPGLRESQMSAACRLLEGEKDFGAFRSAGSGERSTVRKLTRARLRRRGRLWSLDFEGSGFLRHQVRAMVGTLVEVGRSRLSVAEFEAIVGSGKRELAGPTAPPQGLVLVRIGY